MAFHLNDDFPEENQPEDEIITNFYHQSNSYDPDDPVINNT